MRIPIVLTIVLVMLAASATIAVAEPSPKDLVLGMFEAVNQRDFDALDTYVAANVKRHCAATPHIKVENLDQFKAFLQEDLTACPDATQEINLIFESGDMVAVHATYRGTQTGPMGPFPPSGKPVEIPYIGVARVEDGKIVELWAEWDNLNALVQLGHIPAPGAPGAPGVPGYSDDEAPGVPGQPTRID